MLFKNTRLFFSRAGMSHYPGSGAGRRVSEGHPTARCNSDCTNSQARSSVWEGDTSAATPEPASRRDFPRVKVVGRSQLAHINPRPHPDPNLHLRAAEKVPPICPSDGSRRVAFVCRLQKKKAAHAGHRLARCRR